MSVNIKPLEDRIVVKPLDAEQTTASGLVIPDTAKEKPQEGEVLAVGPGRFDDEGEKRIPLDVKVGDTVLYSKYGGTEVKYSGEEYLILPARDGLAVVNEDHRVVRWKPQEGEVVAVGPGRFDDNGNRVPLDVSVGDKVIYSKYGGTEVKYGGDELLILSARDVLAVVS